MNSLQTAAFHGLLLAPQWRAGAKMDHKPSVIPVSSSISITKSLSEIVFLVFYHAACHRYQVPLGSFWERLHIWQYGFPLGKRCEFVQVEELLLYLEIILGKLIPQLCLQDEVRVSQGL